MSKFPQTIYVKLERDGDEHWLAPAKDLIDLCELGKNTKIGIYELTEEVVAVGYVQTF